jgi:hypothetical protein
MYQDAPQLIALVARLEAWAKDQTLSSSELFVLNVASFRLARTLEDLHTRSQAAEATLQATMAGMRWEDEYPTTNDRSAHPSSS